MESEPNIAFRNVDPMPSVREHVLRRIGELEKVYPRIVGCDVVVSSPQRKKQTGQLFEIHLTIRVPGPDIHISDRIGRSFAAEDINVAVHRAFNAARKKLKEQKRRMGGVEIKTHPPVLHGTIDRLFTTDGYGFILADDGKEVYFERDNLTGGKWEDLVTGMKVRFREELGDKGSFASNVTVVQ